MKAELNELMKRVNQHINRYHALARLLDEEQAALTNLDLDRLQETTKAKETLALKIKLLVPAVSAAIDKAAVVLGLPAEPTPTLAELAAAAPKPWGPHLSRASLILARLKREIARHNRANQAFVQESLDLISGSIAILTGAVHQAPQNGYLKSGVKAPRAAAPPSRLSKEV